MSFDAGSIETTLDLDRTPFNRGLDQAERDAREFEGKTFRTKLRVDVDRDQLDKTLADLSRDKRGKIKVDVDVDEDKLDEEVDKATKKAEPTADKAGKRMGSLLLNPIMIQLGLLPGIAAVSAAGVAAAIALPVAGFAAWGIAAEKNNQQVRDSFSSLKTEIVTDSKDFGEVMQPAIVGIAQEAKTAWSGLKPEFQSMFKDASPLVTELSDGLIDLGVNALPGVELSLQRGKKAMEGWNSFLGSVGTGLSDLFDNASRHADAAGVGMEQLGHTVQMLLGFVGSLIGLFTEAWAEIGGNFNGALSSLLSTVLAFARGALPAMSGGFSGILVIIKGLLTILGPFAQTFGDITGKVLGTVAAYKALRLATDGLGKGFSSVKTKIGNLATDLGNSALGVQMFGTNAKETSSKIADSEKTTSKFGNTVQKVGGFLGKVGNSIPIIGAAFVLADSIIQESTKTTDQVADSIDQHFQEQRDRMEKRFSEIRDMSQKTADATNYYNRAVQTLGDDSVEAASAQDKLSKQVLAEKDAQNRAAEATKTHTQRLLEYFDALTGQLNKQVAYNNSVKDLKDKQQALADAIKEHGKNSMDAKFATDELNLAMANQVKAAGDLALANSTGKTEYEKLRDVQIATGQEALKLIDIFGNKAPPALYAVVAGMSDQELAALGAKRSYDNAGNAIIDLNGKKITIQSNLVQTAQDALTLKGRMDSLPEGNHFFNYFINTVVTGPGPGTAPFPIPGHASGTEYFKAPLGLTKIDELGPEIAQLPTGSRIFTAQRSQLMVRDEVQRALAAAGGGGGDTHVNVTINPPPMADQQWLQQVSREVSRNLQWRTRQNG